MYTGEYLYKIFNSKSKNIGSTFNPITAKTDAFRRLLRYVELRYVELRRVGNYLNDAIMNLFESLGNLAPDWSNLPYSSFTSQ